MKFLTAVTLTVVMLWVPVDGAAQTESERRRAELYERRAEEILAQINPEADEQQARAALASCIGGALGTVNPDYERCTRQIMELRGQQAARRSALEQQAFEVRQQGLEILARAARNPPQPSAEAQNRASTTNSARSPNRVSTTDLVRRGDIYLHPSTLEPYTGPVVLMRNNNSVALWTSLRKGRYHGSFEVYHENNQPMEKSFYKDGERHGSFESYNENGQLILKTEFSDGVLDGSHETYHENGQLEAKDIYKNDKLNGTSETYHENGQLQRRANYRDDKLHGPFLQYGEDGQLEVKGAFNMEEPCGEWISSIYEPETNPSCEEAAEALEYPPFENYYPNGQLRDRGTGKDRKFHGPYESYSEDGRLISKGNYNMGAKCGEWLLAGVKITYPRCPPGL